MIKNENIKNKLFIPVSDMTIHKVAENIKNQGNEKNVLIYNFYTGDLNLYQVPFGANSLNVLTIGKEKVNSVTFGYNFSLLINNFDLENIINIINRKLNDIYILFFESFQNNKNLFETKFSEIDKRYFFRTPIWNCQYFYDFYYLHKPINKSYLKFAQMFFEENKEFLNEKVQNWFACLK